MTSLLPPARHHVDAFALTVRAHTAYRPRATLVPFCPTHPPHTCACAAARAPRRRSVVTIVSAMSHTSGTQPTAAAHTAPSATHAPRKHATPPPLPALLSAHTTTTALFERVSSIAYAPGASGDLELSASLAHTHTCSAPPPHATGVGPPLVPNVLSR